MVVLTSAVEECGLCARSFVQRSCTVSTGFWQLGGGDVHDDEYTITHDSFSLPLPYRVIQPCGPRLDLLATSDLLLALELWQLTL